jgi:hypothetical protein
VCLAHGRPTLLGWFAKGSRRVREAYEAFGVPGGNGSTGPFFGLMDPKHTNTLFLLVLSAGTYLSPFTWM